MKQNKKIEVGSLKETALSLLPDLTGFLTPNTITDPKMAIANVGVAIVSKKISQFVEEYKQKKKGKKIKEKLNTKEGSSFYEILKFIDEENPDEERLKAIKSIFFYSIRKDSSEKDENLAYQFIQICKKLTSEDILILKASYDITQKERVPTVYYSNEWSDLLSKQIGHNIPELVLVREENLVNFRLIDQREPGESKNYKENGRLGGGSYRFRLTKLGYSLCKYLSLELN